MVTRVIAALIGLLFVAVSLRAGVNLAAGSWLFAGFTFGTLTIAGLAFWYAISAHGGIANVQWRRSVRAGLLLGTVFLLAGYVVPILATPENNLGPLIGLFGTGPAGFAIGALLGLVRALRDRDATT